MTETTRTPSKSTRPAFPLWLTLVTGAMILAVVASPLTGLGAASAQEYLRWRGEYYDNEGLQGTPRLVRYENEIKFRWGSGRPAADFPRDHFSARWTAIVFFEPGRYRFNAYVDDGVRVWFDGREIISAWNRQPVTLYRALVEVSAGYHDLKVEYFENIGDAICEVWWEKEAPLPPHEGELWRGEYFDNRDLNGFPVLVRNDSEINFDWGYAAPGPGVPADNFSVRWTRYMWVENRTTFTFYALHDDGLRMAVDGSWIISAWYDQRPTTHQATVTLDRGWHTLQVDYYEHTEVAVAKVWSTPGIGPGVTPSPTVCPREVVIDDYYGSGFYRYGPNEGWFAGWVGYQSHVYWTYNSYSDVINYARWKPNLVCPGNYEIYAYIPRQYANTTAARYRIHHSGQDHYKVINQSIYFNQWVSLGTYYFTADGSEYVQLADPTYEYYLSRKLGFDAMKFVRRGAPAATPVPPTATPTAGPTPTATSTSVPVPVCSQPLAGGFATVWNAHPEVRTGLGCPIAPEASIQSAEQTFKNGYMYWRADLRYIYVLYTSDHTWAQYIDYWHEGDPEWDPSIVPPAGLYQPKRGFGKVWREQPGVRSKIGWGTIEERALSAAYQSFEHGLMIWSASQGLFVLYDNHTWAKY